MRFSHASTIYIFHALHPTLGIVINAHSYVLVGYKTADADNSPYLGMHGNLGSVVARDDHTDAVHLGVWSSPQVMNWMNCLVADHLTIRA